MRGSPITACVLAALVTVSCADGAETPAAATAAPTVTTVTTLPATSTSISPTTSAAAVAGHPDPEAFELELADV
ncbi:MAG: hypothetical protein ACLGHQ_05670, partial [Acidimicrobiia bacterium]